MRAVIGDANKSDTTDRVVSSLGGAQAHRWLRFYQFAVAT